MRHNRAMNSLRAVRRQARPLAELAADVFTGARWAAPVAWLGIVRAGEELAEGAQNAAEIFRAGFRVARRRRWPKDAQGVRRRPSGRA